MEDIIRKYALDNAVKFEGKANPGAVIGKVLKEDPSLKENMKEVSKEINSIIKDVNSLGLERQKKELEKYAKDLPEKKPEKKKGLKELKNVSNKVVMRFEPSPSGPMHLGHAYALSLNSEYTRKYDGKLILRIADTNPENIYEPAYELLPEDGVWLTKKNISKVFVQSENLGKYYDYAEKLVSMGKAYVCECSSDRFRELIFKKEQCPCRRLSKKEHEERYAKMFSSYKPGEAVLRLKTELNHPNPAMRDFPLMRVNEHEHPKQGTRYRVWPLMNLAVFVDDVELGITHILRAKDHMDNAKRQEYLYNYLGKPIPETIFIGKINFEGMPMSCSKVRVLIEEGKYSGWDDIRLPFLRALKRRGYTPEAFIIYALDVGVTQTDKSVDKEEFFKALNHFNKEIIDDKSDRYFFVSEPEEIVIEGAPEQEVKLMKHPEHKKRGYREFKTHDRFYISKDDLKLFKDGEMVRLMDCLNFKKKKDKFVFDSTDHSKYKEEGRYIIHWLPALGNLVDAEILMPDGSLIKGYAESAVSRLKVGDIVQFERVGFCRLDKKEKDKIIFWFGHR
ncbi:glutamate--tRNA ligase [Candidatus Woesearchaeota archaeon]|nr:glutamate--tRNA ligase [Candidatus Woesearchaeota archaeon]